MSTKKESIQRISVIVPENPFALSHIGNKSHCLSALDVDKLMQWWPGTPHSPHRKPEKVKAIQRSLDWKRVAQIATYLLQKEMFDVPDRLDKYFRDIYQPKKSEPGREWPPKINKVIGFNRTEFPTFSNVLIHVNGASIKEIEMKNHDGAANLVFDENDKKLNFSVIDGQHRINGAYLALCILREENPDSKWQIPAEIFLDLDAIGSPPRLQAQIFIDVNFYQKKVDRSLVADLFPTARGPREAIDQKERTQDIGRKLMLETGPLVGMIQIPGIRYGVKDVIALSTLNTAIEDILDIMEKQGILSLEMQTDFIAQCLSAWLVASGRYEEEKLSPQNVVYQGRVLVSVIDLIPFMIWKLREEKIQVISDEALMNLTIWLKDIIKRANLLENGRFINKNEFKKKGYLGSGGISRFRDSLWATVIGKNSNSGLRIDQIAERANNNRRFINNKIQTS
jgi:DGQHR domain-containing protein